MKTENVLNLHIANQIAECSCRKLTLKQDMFVKHYASPPSPSKAFVVTDVLYTGLVSSK